MSAAMVHGQSVERAHEEWALQRWWTKTVPDQCDRLTDHPLHVSVDLQTASHRVKTRQRETQPNWTNSFFLQLVDFISSYCSNGSHCDTRIFATAVSLKPVQGEVTELNWTDTVRFWRIDQWASKASPLVTGWRVRRKLPSNGVYCNALLLAYWSAVRQKLNRVSSVQFKSDKPNFIPSPDICDQSLKFFENARTVNDG